MKPRILLVDDMAFEWEAAQQKLGGLYELVWKTNGEDAYAELLLGSDAGFAALIIDYNMGPGNGLWLCERLAERGFCVPVLVNTHLTEGRRKMLSVLREAGIPCGTTRLAGSLGQPLSDVQNLLSQV